MKSRVVLASVLFVVAVLSFCFLLKETNIAVLNPKGPIAFQEKELLITATCLMLLIVLPVLVLTLGIIWKYRAQNLKAKYMPAWGDSLVAECIWWGFPLAIVAVLSVLTWKSCHQLDPFKPLSEEGTPVRVQVVALQWKWLFIYPEQGVVSVNVLRLPEKTPINFEITADAPMNSFWIPQLGGQIYAMAGMSTKLHLFANETGVFRGGSANLSGTGFADMTFVAEVTSQTEFTDWASKTKASALPITAEAYNLLVEPSILAAPQFYTLSGVDLYQQILSKYMMPEHKGE